MLLLSVNVKYNDIYDLENLMLHKTMDKELIEKYDWLDKNEKILINNLIDNLFKTIHSSWKNQSLLMEYLLGKS